MQKSNILGFRAKSKQLDNFNLFLLLAFFLITAVGILNHEMWRDELQAWLIAKDSSSIAEILENLKHTGHPALWYLYLHLLSKLTNNPLIIQLFQLVVASSIVFVFVYYSTFNNLQKALFCFGFFPLYEYGIISRSYSLGLLLIFSFCVLFCRKNHNYIYLAIVLALLSHTSVYGIIIGFSLAIMLVYNMVEENYLAKSNYGEHNDAIAEIIISITIYLAALSTAIIQIIPPSKIKYASTIGSKTQLYNQDNSLSFLDKILEYIKESEVVITGIWRSYVPIPNRSFMDFRGSNILANNPQLPEIGNLNIGSLAAAFLSLILFIFFIIAFARKHKILFVYTFTTLAITFFGLLIKTPAIRHSGHLFIVLVACCWIYIYEVGENRSTLSSSAIINFCRQYYSLLLTIILCIQLYAGIRIYSADLVQSFSSSKNVAQFIKKNNLEELTIVGSRDTSVAPISAWLNREIYYPGIKDFGTYTVGTTKINEVERNRDISQQDIIKEIERLIDRNNQSLLLILSSNKLQPISTPLNIELLKSFEDSIIARERYYVYYVSW